MIRASSPNAQIASLGVATTAKMNSTVAASLHSGASRWTPESACTKNTWVWAEPPPIGISRSRARSMPNRAAGRFRKARMASTAAPAMTKHSTTPMTPDSPVESQELSTPVTA